MKKSLLFVLLAIVFGTLHIRPVSARVFDVADASVIVPPVSPDNSIAVYPDEFGNQFLMYEWSNPRVLKKLTPQGAVAWSVTFPSITTSNARGVPDNNGGFYYVYTKLVTPVGFTFSVSNMFVLHYSSGGTYSAQEVQLFATALKHQISGAFADNAGNLFVVFSEQQFGDNVGMNLSYKIAKVSNTGAILNGAATVPLTPTEARWCTNRGASIAIPFDIAYSGHSVWSACWGWCQTEFATNSGTCQYNSDGPRNCWVNPFPAGGVGNCTWENFVPGYPPYSGYHGMTLSNQPTVNETLYSYANAAGMYSSVGISRAKATSDGGVIFMLSRSELDYSAGSPPLTTNWYIQKVNSSGVPQIPGWGTDITGITGGSSANVVDDGFVFISTVDTNGDTKADTVRVQRYNTLGAPQFSGSGVDVFTLIETGTDLSAFAVARGTGLTIIIEAYNDTVPPSGDVEKIFVQAIDASGVVQLGSSGVQIASYTDDPAPEYAWDADSDGNGGTFITTYHTSFTDPFRVFWLNSSNQVKHVSTNGLIFGTGQTYDVVCSGDTTGTGVCLLKNIAVDNEFYSLLPAYQITTAGGLRVTNSNGNPITIDSDYGISSAFAGYQDMLTGRDGSNIPIFQVSTTVSSDRNWSTVTAETDTVAKKSYAHNVITAPGAAATYDLLVPRVTGDNGVLVCPDALALVDVGETCTNSVLFGNGEARGVAFPSGATTVTASQVTLESQTFWKLSGMKGSGGISVADAPSQPPTSIPPTTSPPDSGTPTVTDDEVTPTPTPSDTIIVVTLPPVTTAGPTNPPQFVCPVFTSFTVSATLVEPGSEVTFSWKTQNTTAVIWYGEEANMEVSGTRTFVPATTTKIQLLADNGKCSAKVEKTVRVVETSPWKNSTAVGVGALAVEAAVIQVAALYQMGATAVQQAGGGVQGNLWLALAGFLDRRRKKKWGIVYDAVTKKPITRAVVRLVEQTTGKVIDTAVSDAKGIVRLSASPGTYVVQAVHPAYKFPSELVKLPSDGGYANVYRGEPLTITETQTTLLVSIPLDPLELTPAMKRRVQGMAFIENAGNYGSLTILTVGMIYSSYAALAYPHAFNYIAVGIYSFLLLSKAALVFIKPKVAGTVHTVGGKAVSGLEIGLFDAEFKNLVYRTFTNSKGQYTFFVNNGIYLLKIMDERYSILRHGKPVNEMLMLPKEESESVRYIAEDLTLEAN